MVFWPSRALGKTFRQIVISLTPACSVRVQHYEKAGQGLVSLDGIAVIMKKL